MPTFFGLTEIRYPSNLFMRAEYMSDKNVMTGQMGTFFGKMLKMTIIQNTLKVGSFCVCKNNLPRMSVETLLCVNIYIISIISM